MWGFINTITTYLFMCRVAKGYYDVIFLFLFYSKFSLIFSLLPGADQEGHPTSFSGNSVAAAGKRHRHASKEPVLWVTEDVLALREAHPQRYCPHIPWTWLLQRPGQFGSGGPVQCNEGERRSVDKGIDRESDLYMFKEYRIFQTIKCT